MQMARKAIKVLRKKLVGKDKALSIVYCQWQTRNK